MSVADRRPLDPRVLLSTLWVFVLFNILFADFHSLITPGTLEEIMSGSVSGFETTEETLLIAAIVHQIPILMLLLSRVLPRTPNRWSNFIAGGLYLVFTITGGPTDLDHIFFRIVMAAALAFILWTAWKWLPASPEEEE